MATNPAPPSDQPRVRPTDPMLRDEGEDDEIGPTPGTAEGEPGGNSPVEAGPGRTRGKSEGRDDVET